VARPGGVIGRRGGRAAWKYALALATLGCTVLAGILSTLILVELGKSFRKEAFY
jgi:hypothetical protein